MNKKIDNELRACPSYNFRESLVMFHMHIRQYFLHKSYQRKYRSERDYFTTPAYHFHTQNSIHP